MKSTVNFTLPAAPRILVRGTNWLGDAVMTTPALLRLREKFPGAQITLLTPEKLQELWPEHPAVDEVIPFAADQSVWETAGQIRALHHAPGRRHFDAALVLPNSPRSALEVRLARIPLRVGCARPWRNWFLTQAIAPRPEAVTMRKRSVDEIKKLISAPPAAKARPPASAHQLHEYLHLAAALGANPEPVPPQLFVRPAEVDAARKKFGLEKIAGPIFGLNPGAEYGPAKRWPADKFIAVAREIQERTRCTWLIFGGPADTGIAHRIESAIPSPPTAMWNVAGKTSLRELMALLKLCRLLLTNDSGPMHVAAALGTPVVVPFGSTSSELTGPGLPGALRHHVIQSDVPCNPCFLRECPIDLRCQNGISVERVTEAVLRTLR